MTTTASSSPHHRTYWTPVRPPTASSLHHLARALATSFSVGDTGHVEVRVPLSSGRRGVPGPEAASSSASPTADRRSSRSAGRDRAPSWQTARADGGGVESALTGGDQVTTSPQSSPRTALRGPSTSARPGGLGASSSTAAVGSVTEAARRPGDVKVAADDGAAVVLDHPAEPEIVEVADVIVHDGHRAGRRRHGTDRSHRRLDFSETRATGSVGEDEAVEAVASAVRPVVDVGAVPVEGDRRRRRAAKPWSIHSQTKPPCRTARTARGPAGSRRAPPGPLPMACAYSHEHERQPAPAASPATGRRRSSGVRSSVRVRSPPARRAACTSGCRSRRTA